MKNIGILVLFFTTLFSFGQTGKCDYDFEEKTDSTYIKKTNDYLIYEKDLGSLKDMIQFSLINSDGTLILIFKCCRKVKISLNPTVLINLLKYPCNWLTEKL
ncbi:hypothetical protein [Flavobacterium sp.]|uniref:hypothetical protein n=1 Tax=Flavobacterium sp. TaxID=239 RepID=UPI0028BED4FB|nr:hypothetical protein [Flavobacterium sp.]